jgi:subtilisin-like proprotein convertase family protein
MKSLLVFVIPVLISLPVCTAQESYMAASGNIVEYCSHDVPQDILDNQTITSALTISDVGDIADLDVKVNINHMWISDLIVELIAPDGTRTELFSAVGRDQGQFDNTILDDEASVSIKNGSSPYSGTYKPEGNLSRFYGKSMTGTWKLEVSDTASSDSGTLNSWCIIIEKKPYESIDSPVIHSERSTPGGICDKVEWDIPLITREFQSEYGGSIPFIGTKRYTIDIDDPNIIRDLDVKLNITHEYDSELQVYLVSPDMTRIKLFSGVGDSSQDFVNTILDSDASLSITEGTGPFTGFYRPEGNLNELIGQNIRGRWVLEITDYGLDFMGSGSVNSWSLIADLADVSYFAQCATNSGFSNLITQSGWISEDSYTFTDLDPQQTYSYRVKARPLMRWFQTTRSDFKNDILTDVVVTNDGKVQLPVADSIGGPDMEVNVIANPSFDSGGGWVIHANSNIFIGASSGEDSWASDGPWSICVNYDHSELYFYDYSARIYQTVNFTDVDTLVFDYACYGYCNLTLISVEIDGISVWRTIGPEAYDIQPSYNETIDVSSYSGPHELALKVKCEFNGWFDAYIYWDNFRTYRTISEEVSPGSIVSTPMNINADQKWDTVNYNATIPEGTALTVDVLPANGTTPITGYSDIPSGADISNISQKTIRLRANLSTTQRHITPTLHDWSVDYENPAFVSDWSNVVSSDCN